MLSQNLAHKQQQSQKNQLAAVVKFDNYSLKHTYPLVTSSGITERGKSKYKVHLGKKQIGTIVHSSPNCFGAALSPLFGDCTEVFNDRHLAVNWLVARYRDWQNKPITIDWSNCFYVVRHGHQYIGSFYFSEEKEPWVATVDSPHSKFALIKTRTFDQAKKVIVKAHLG